MACKEMKVIHVKICDGCNRRVPNRFFTWLKSLYLIDGNAFVRGKMRAIEFSAQRWQG